MGVPATKQMILALGSNVDADRNLRLAMDLLCRLWPEICFTQPVWTEPVGMVSDLFLNCLAVADVTEDEPTIHTLLKQMETQIGSVSADRKQGRVVIDIDLLLLGGDRYHPADWNRPYMPGLFRSLKDMGITLSMP